MIIALGVFVVILIASASAWDNAHERIYLAEQRNDLEAIARNAMSSLILTTGSPADWYLLSTENFNEINIKSIGLADSIPYKLKSEKIQALKDPNKYTTIKKILGIIGPGYEFFLEINAYDGVQFSETNQIGLVPDGTAQEVVVVERGAAYGTKWAVIRLRVWKHE